MEIRIKIFDGEKDVKKVMELVKALKYPRSNQDKTFLDFFEVIKRVEFLASSEDFERYLRQLRKEESSQ